ncbi:MAG: Gfo/Idh/MocA family oxidoreductase [Acutalibacteraceae bacterium]|nr:Gfo/Idh/MocA family oxidoreductase [Acutalibacteraceae bacterium]
MKKVRIGIICPSEIAFRRFMPALKKCEQFEYVGVAHANKDEWFCDDLSEFERISNSDRQKAQNFCDTYGGKIYESYAQLLCDENVDAIYLPLPPALHYKWADSALKSGKHVFLEKPSATRAVDTQDLVKTAKEKRLALHENYMFSFHSQLDEIAQIVKSGELGDIRLYRIAFGFPMRGADDFRYKKSLGGGALLDCGGYTIKLAYQLLGDTAEVKCSTLNFTDDFDVDLYGSAALCNNKNEVAQITFGMDNSYKCDLEIWGSKACLLADRIFTAPVDFTPTAHIKSANGIKNIEFKSDDTFKKSIEHFYSCIVNENIKNENYAKLIKQAQLVDKVKGVK